MFNVNTAITEWRQKMRAAGIKTPVPLDELENHLREEIERQTRAGKTGEEAFETAVQRMGPASALKREFKKIEASEEERARAPKEKLCIIAGILIPLAMFSMVLFKFGNPSLITSEQQLSCLSAAAAFTLLFWSGRLGYRLFPVIRARRTRNFITGGLSVLPVPWLIAFTCLILPRWEFTLGQVFVAIFWGVFMPTGVVSGWAWGIETAAHKRGAMAVS